MKNTKLPAVLSAAALLALVGCAAEAEDPEVEEEQTDEETVEEQAQQLTSLTGEERAAYRDTLSDEELFALHDMLSEPYEAPEVEDALVTAAGEALEEHATFFTPRDEDTSVRVNPGSYYEASISVVGDHDGGEVSSDEITDQVCDYMEAVVEDVAAADVTEFTAHNVSIDVEIRHTEEPTVHAGADYSFQSASYGTGETCP